MPYVKIIMYDARAVSLACLVFNEASCNVMLAYVLRVAFTICYARLCFKIRVCAVYVRQHQDIAGRDSVGYLYIVYA